MNRILALQMMSTYVAEPAEDLSTQSRGCSSATTHCSTASTGCKEEAEFGW